MSRPINKKEGLAIYIVRGLAYSGWEAAYTSELLSGPKVHAFTVLSYAQVKKTCYPLIIDYSMSVIRSVWAY